MKAICVFEAFACKCYCEEFPELTNFVLCDGLFANAYLAQKVAEENSAKGLEKYAKTKLVYKQIFENLDEYHTCRAEEDAQNAEKWAELQNEFDNIFKECNESGNTSNKPSKNDSRIRQIIESCEVPEKKGAEHSPKK